MGPHICQLPEIPILEYLWHMLRRYNCAADPVRLDTWESEFTHFNAVHIKHLCFQS
jgi:hypothetical protein